MTEEKKPDPLASAEGCVTLLMVVTGAIGLFLVAVSSDLEDITKAGFSTVGVLLMAVVIQLSRHEP